ncbi:MAG: thioesterase, partial [Burkholderiales bacterium]
AGGIPGAFRFWRDGLAHDIELSAIQLPGRAGRLREPPISSIPQLTEQITSALIPRLDIPYVFFGHSMGAVLALEVAKAIANAGGAAPAHVFLSARRPPHLPRLEADLHRLPDDAFLKLLGARYGGVPVEVLQEPELLALFLPTLRADITALETFAADGNEPITSALTATGGDDDRLVSLDQLRAWRGYTTGAFRVKQYRGGHFYLTDARDELLADISRVLASLVATADRMTS